MKHIRVSSLETLLLTGVRTVGLPRNLLQILATLPSFNSYCWPKFQHSETPEDLSENNHGNRLTGLALLSMHTNRPINKEEILKTLFRVKGVDQTLVFNYLAV